MTWGNLGDCFDFKCSWDNQELVSKIVYTSSLDIYIRKILSGRNKWRNAGTYMGVHTTDKLIVNIILIFTIW